MPLPVESSWRMVEGENDSFDTTIVRDDLDDELLLSSDPSQLSGSQPWSIGGSQDDNLESFLSRADRDEQVILRSPFRPSVPPAVRQNSRDNMRHPRSPDPEFYMPAVDVDSPRRTRSGAMPAQTSPAALRRRQAAPDGPVARRRGRAQTAPRRSRPDGENLLASLPAALLDAAGWALGLVGLAFRYAQRPLAVFLAAYFVLGGLVVVQNMASRSLSASLSPLCRVPGAGLLGLPFCGATEKSQTVEFDGLMGVQERFEEVLEKSAQGASLPLEMKRSEASVRDLRTMVRYSGLASREELVHEFEGFIEAARTASSELQRFNTRVGSAVDSVISINRWTSRYMDGLAAERSGRGRLGEWAAWLLSPFSPAFSERALLDKYVEHTALVSERIGGLIVEAQAVLRTLAGAEEHLGVIYELVTRTQRSVQGRRDEILWTVWTLVGVNARHVHRLDEQLALLRQVDGQRAGAVRQVSELIVELEKIEAGLGDLRDRVAEPEIARGRVEVPLRVHVETVNRGVERLEQARARIRAAENERIREVLARGGEGARGDEGLIEGRGERGD